jgi:hypothetical protein
LHTNHFLDPAPAPGDRPAAIGDDTLPRMEVPRDRKKVLTGANRTEWAEGLVLQEGGPCVATADGRLEVAV